MVLIKKSFSKEGQDLLVNLLLPKKGFFIDIGCGHPIDDGNNTYSLELIGWVGMLIDKCPISISQCKALRSSPAFLIDCSYVNWLQFLNENNVPKVIDYISLDIQDSNIDVINNFPFDEYEFKIMTFETDCYQCGNLRKDHALRILSRYNQYQMVLENARLESGGIWEDWWINEKFINAKNLYCKERFWFDFIKYLKKWKTNLLI